MSVVTRVRVTLVCVIVALAAVAVPAAAHAKPVKPKLLVSLGDSYASGYQASGVGQGRNTRHGFAYQIPAAAKKRGWKLKLVNFGCGGATTSSLITQKGCAPQALGPGGKRYPKITQAAAAARFLKANRGKVGLVTVSIGGNDVTRCAREADAVACVGEAVKSIDTNLATLLRRLRKAAGPKVRIVGITYPDVILGGWVTGVPAAQDLARLSVVAFRQFINPSLKKQYEAVGGRFVDVTAATGAYGSLDETTTLAPYGTIPVPVARVCELTYYCRFQDIHANTKGYGLIADLVARTLPRRQR
jgi:lysophospholipase L1-like esterase